MACSKLILRGQIKGLYRQLLCPWGCAQTALWSYMGLHSTSMATNKFEGYSQNAKYLLYRFYALPWQKKPARPSYLQTYSVCASVATFLIYFLYLREPNDIDEEMSRPIWERLPGIDPDRAEKMMELDKHLGFQVDYEGLEKYKEWYYSQDPSTFEQSVQNKPIKENFKRKSSG